MVHSLTVKYIPSPENWIKSQSILHIIGSGHNSHVPYKEDKDINENVDKLEDGNFIYTITKGLKSKECIISPSDMKWFTTEDKGKRYGYWYSLSQVEFFKDFIR